MLKKIKPLLKTCAAGTAKLLQIINEIRYNFHWAKICLKLRLKNDNEKTTILCVDFKIRLTDEEKSNFLFFVKYEVCIEILN